MQRANDGRSIRQCGKTRQDFTISHARQRCLDRTQFAAILAGSIWFGIKRFEVARTAILPQQNQRPLLAGSCRSRQGLQILNERQAEPASALSHRTQQGTSSEVASQDASPSNA